ncbi:MAG: hypothetical protein GF355_17710, partial [Candidatus Eisenbacteria bacterium]|nr:hypothetical protein [Candidatus Eisenbacteria bacterium]
PTIDEQQWSDFPGGRTLGFAGRTWRVKGPGYYGPGPNVFCDEPDCVWVDGEGRLHLTLADRDGTWSSTEVALEDTLGYGDYIVTTIGRLDLIDPQAVLGIFLWQYGPCWGEEFLWWNPYNEIDIEYSRWGNPGEEIGQFVAQPYDYPGNLERFDAAFVEGESVSHAMRWLSDRVEFRVWRGGAADESPETMIHAWTYEGPHIPRPEQPRLHLNLWKLAGGDPAAGQEVVFQDFMFVPASGAADTGRPVGEMSATSAGRLLPARPNPFGPRTRIQFELIRTASVELGIFSADGRLVRTLVESVLEPGRHGVIWDGQDHSRRPVGSGVYLIRLNAAGFTDTRRVTLIR